MSDLPGHDTFERLAGTEFEIEAADGRKFGAALSNVSELITRGPQEQFSITFGVKTEEYLEQSLYDVRCEGLDAVALFLVPVGQDEKGLQMQAVFNTIKKD